MWHLRCCVLRAATAAGQSQSDDHNFSVQSMTDIFVIKSWI